MTFQCILNLYTSSLNRAEYLWHMQGLRSGTDLLSLLCNPSCPFNAKRPLSYRDFRLNWQACGQKSRVRRAYLCNYRPLGHKVFTLNKSVCFKPNDLNRRMSRIKNTWETVSKAVSGTQSEIFSKITWLKPSTGLERIEGVAGAETTPLKDQDNGALAPQPPSTATSSPGTAAETSSRPSHYVQQQKEIKNKSSTTTESQAKSGEPVSSAHGSSATKKTAPLFHPSSFSVNLDETYNYLAHHVNTYFRSFTKTPEEKKGASDCSDKPLSPPPDHCNQNSDLIPSQEHVKDQPSAVIPTPLSSQDSPSSSPKKGLGHYLVSPTVQALVGSYIAPLVPRFRTEPKGLLPDGDTPPPPEDLTLKEKETVEIKEQRAADEKAKRLLLQREKIIARVSVDNRTRALVQALRRASDVRLYVSRVEELSLHLLEFPETRLVAVKEKVIPCLLRLRQASDPSLKAAVREALALVGYIEPVKNKGIRILSIDGGGTRGLVALQTLQKLEELSGKPIYQLFDYICGVSTGAILGMMLGMFHIPLSDCEELYRRLSSDVFKQNVILGTVKMGWSHAFYDTEVWEKVLKEKMGSDIMIETSRNPDCPKVSAVSAVVNKGTPLKAYVFRNYNLPLGVRSHYRGACHHKMWEAIRASSAAPGYFQEFALGTDLHQDGGLLVNNPTALAVHECQCLWPDTPLQCVVSLGTGRFENASKNITTYTSLKTKLTNVISSATDTEEVHTMLDALLPPNTYFRFNPYMSEDVALDESRSEKLNQLQVEGVRYLERNEDKLQRAVRTLMREKSSVQRLVEWVRLKAHMYDSLTGISKL